METTAQRLYSEFVLDLFQEAYDKYKRVRYLVVPTRCHLMGDRDHLSRWGLYTSIKADKLYIAKPRRVKLSGCHGLGLNTEGIVLGGYIQLAHAGIDVVMGPMTLAHSYERQRSCNTFPIIPHLKFFHEILPHAAVLTLGKGSYALGINARVGSQAMLTYIRVRAS